MANTTYDIITIGGGLGGSALAKAMAEHGAKVLVLERETQFKDRVRGEVLWPWGVVELQKLGSYELLRKSCAREMVWFDTYLGSERFEHRDLEATTPQQVPALNWRHPEMEEMLLQAAADAGAEVRRGASVRDVRPGASPSVVVEQDGHSEQVSARLVVCADGKGSMARKWAGFTTHQDVYGLLIAGVLFEEMPGFPEEINYWGITPSLGQAVFIAPQSGGRMRAYLMYRRDTKSLAPVRQERRWRLVSRKIRRRQCCSSRLERIIVSARSDPPYLENRIVVVTGVTTDVGVGLGAREAADRSLRSEVFDRLERQI